MLQLFLLSIFTPILAASFATNAPAVQRRDDQQVLGPGTLGWRSITTIGSSTSYNQRSCSPGTTWSVAGDGPTKYGCCVTGASCPAVATACLGGYRVYSNAANPSSSSYCSQSCYHDIVFQSLGDTNPPTTMFWCGTYTTGGTVYRISPQQAAASPTANPAVSGQSKSSSGGSPTDTASAQAPTSPAKNNSIGAIVGGAVGGFAVLLLAIVAVFAILRRRKMKQQQQQPMENNPPAYYAKAHEEMPGVVEVHELPSDAHEQTSEVVYVHKVGNEQINELPGSEPPATTR